MVRPEVQAMLDDLNACLKELGYSVTMVCSEFSGGETLVAQAPDVPKETLARWLVDEIQDFADEFMVKHKVKLKRPDFLEQRIAKRKEVREEVSTQPLKMYVLIHERVPDKLAPLVASHASLAGYLKYKDEPSTVEWVNSVFLKVICKVNEDQWERGKRADNHHILTESALDGQEVAMVFCPRKEWPVDFKYFPLWRPQGG